MTMKLKTSLFLPLAIFASLTNSQAANIIINYLPYTISAPGTYVLNTDLTAIPNSYAILINQPVGNVTLDLKGHTLHMSGNTSYGIIAKMSGGFPGIVTIQNGTISVSAYGLDVKTNLSQQKNTNLVVQNMTFSNNTTSAEDIYLEQTLGVQVESCKFVGVGRLGIMDENSPTGNTFTNLSFDGKLSVNMMEDGTPPLIVNFSSHR
jgi:hypothetical protein